ncbi:MAG: S9 family peptidase [Bacteroidetes bacterium]|nr:S9 family peptidase [Bacteroidota bacterium]
MKKLYISLMLCAITLSSMAQQKPNYELAERFTPTKIHKMIYNRTVNPNWLKTGDMFWYSYKTSQGKKWYIVNPAKKSKTELFDNAYMAREITLLARTPFDAQHLPIENIRFNNASTSFTFEIANKYHHENKKDTIKGKKDSEKGDAFFFSYNLNNKKLELLKNYNSPKDSKDWASFSPDKKTIVFAKNNNLFYMDKENYNKVVVNEEDSTIIEHQLTTDGVVGFEYGEGIDYKDNVTVEKNKDKRKSPYIIWSPDSKKFAIVRYDTRKTRKLWVINPLSSPRPTLKSYSYLMPGEDNAPQESLYIFDMASKEIKEVDIAKYKDQTLSINSIRTLKKNYRDTINPSIWAGDKNTIFVTRQSRDIKRIDVAKVDISTLSVKELYADSMNVSIETRSPYITKKGDELIAWSELDGWGHFYLYDTEGNLKNQITKGEMHTDKLVNVDEENRILYFTAYGANKSQNPYYEHLCSINLDGSNFKILNKGDYTFSSSMCDSKNYFVSNYSRVDANPETALYNNKGRKIMNLETADLTQLMAFGYKFPERFTVKADDGMTDLYGVMYKPFDFDPNKKYPIIEYVYPGPQTEAVNAYFSPSMTRLEQLAQLGFIVITVGNRGGSPLRSEWYHSFGYGNLRDYGLADKKRVIEALSARHDFIDINRVGIQGHSGGGFMSTAAILTYPDFFKVAVSCAGNHDNTIYNSWWGEKHQGVYEETTDGETKFVFEITKNQDLAKNLKGKLMLVHGVVDDNVHIANTYRVIEALIKANKRFDFVVLPSEDHSFRNKDTYFFWRMADYFSQHLLGESNRDITDIKELHE